VAVVSRLSDEHLARVRIVTYGCQVRAWYGRIFPAVLGPQAIGYRVPDRAQGLTDPRPDAPGLGPARRVPRPPDSLLERLEPDERPRWVNLFRRSDPLGFRVFTDDDGGRDILVPEVPEVTAGDPGPHVMTHSGYQHTTAYAAVVQEWYAEVPPSPTTRVRVRDVRPFPEG
jgi:hypothetical protein